MQPLAVPSGLSSSALDSCTHMQENGVVMTLRNRNAGPGQVCEGYELITTFDADLEGVMLK